MYLRHILCVIFITHWTSVWSTQWGAFDMKVRSIGNCANSGTGEIVLSNLKIQMKKNNPPLFSGTFYSKYATDDKINMELDVFNFQNNKWKLTFHLHVGPICESAKKYFPNFLKDLERYNIICPMKAGNYTVNNVPLAFKLEVPVLEYGKYKFECPFIRKKTRVGCIFALSDIVPKRS